VAGSSSRFAPDRALLLHLQRTRRQEDRDGWVGRREIGQEDHHQLSEAVCRENMTTTLEKQPAGLSASDLKQIASDVVKQAMQRGASAAEAVLRDGSEFSTVVRKGDVETLKESGSKAIGLRVFLGQRAASTYSSDFSRSGIERLVAGALDLARVTSEDPHAGLPNKDELGQLPGDLDLYYDDVYSLPTDQRID